VLETVLAIAFHSSHGMFRDVLCWETVLAVTFHSSHGMFWDVLWLETVLAVAFHRSHGMFWDVLCWTRVGNQSPATFLLPYVYSDRERLNSFLGLCYTLFSMYVASFSYGQVIGQEEWYTQSTVNR
jgi:hypothetical protein